MWPWRWARGGTLKTKTLIAVPIDEFIETVGTP